MEPRRRRAVAAVPWAIALCGCAAGPPPPPGDAPLRRRPDGVSIDPPAALPHPTDSARTTEAVVALRTPLGSDAAFELLRAYVRAIATEDATAMNALHTGDAAFVLSPPGQPPRSFPGAAGLWERRFARLDYDALAGTVVVREAEATVQRVPTGVDPVLPTPPDDEGTPSPAQGAELVLRAPITTSRIGGQPLLGTELVLYLRRDGNAWRVAAVVEDYAMP